MEKRLLEQIRSYNFAAYDMLLYLDTHPDDAAGFKLYRERVEKCEALKKEYEKSNGPLTAFAAAKQDSFNWIKSPWPWQKEAN